MRASACIRRRGSSCGWLWLLVLIAMLLAGCSSSDSTTKAPGLAATDGDGDPAMYAVPTFSPTTMPVDATSMVVNVPVDSDVTYLEVQVGTASTLEGSGSAIIGTPSRHIESVTVALTSLTQGTKLAYINACNSNPCDSNNNRENIYTPFGTSPPTYLQSQWNAGVRNAIETGVAVPTFTVTAAGGGGGGGITGTNGDGVAELTAAPTYVNGSILTTDASFQLQVPVDSDTGYYSITLFPSASAAGSTDDAAFAEGATTSTGTAHTETVTISSTSITQAGLSAGTYLVEVVVCANATDCNVNHTGTAYVRSATVAGTFERQNVVGGTQQSASETGVSIPVLTVTAAGGGGGGGGGGGLTSTDGDGKAELTAVPTYSPTTVLTTDLTMTVNVPVDSDTKFLLVVVGSYTTGAPGTMTVEGSGSASIVTPSVHTEAVIIDLFGLTAGTRHAQVFACPASSGSCPSAGSNEVWYVDSDTAPGTFVKVDVSGGSSTETGVSIPTFTAQ